MQKLKFFLIVIGFLILVGGIFVIFKGCKITDSDVREAMNPITLEYWRVFDNSSDFQEVIDKYKAIYPYITINYKKFRYDEYEEEILNAFAEDRSPDIFSIHNTWMKKYQDRFIIPITPKSSMVHIKEVGTVKKEYVYEKKDYPGLAPIDVKRNFIDAVYDDVVLDSDEGEKVYGLPLFVDTLALYYNRDLLNEAGIISPPEYWNEDFQEMVKKLTVQNSQGRIIQSGIAMGGSDNIERSFDILSVLMMQNKAVMMENGRVKFSEIPYYFSAQKYNPGLDALRFYTDFADPAKEVYCWNSNLDNSLDMFVEGKLAFMPGYAYHRPTIIARAPKLDFDIVKLPQIEGNTEANYANYWVETVSRKTKNPEEAWHFVQFITSAENVGSFFDATGKPTALRALVEEQREDKILKPFAEQLLTADSWYEGENPLIAEEIMLNMIDEMTVGEKDSEAIIEEGADKIQQTVN